MIFYLSGGMEYKVGDGSRWRKNMTDSLRQLGHDTIDPVVEEAKNPVKIPPKQWHVLDEYRQAIRTAFILPDMNLISASDAMILLYDDSVRRGAGTLAEAYECFRQDKPLLVYTCFPLAEVPGWLIGESTWICTSRTELLEYVLERYT